MRKAPGKKLIGPGGTYNPDGGSPERTWPLARKGALALALWAVFYAGYFALKRAL